MSVRLTLVISILAMTLAACGGTPIQYYQPQVAVDQVQRMDPVADVVLSVETFATDSAYDDQRIVYRTSDYRFNFYHFHRWSSSPGNMVSTVLREVYRRTGAFEGVVGGLDARARALLGGRVVAIEEYDVGEEEWLAHVALELTLRDNMTGRVLWNELVEEREPIAEKTPEGVTLAVSIALTRIGTRTAPIIADAAASLPSIRNVPEMDRPPE